MDQKQIKSECINTSFAKFSIIIPAYNYEDVVARAIKSASSQCYQFYEVIIINDGSTDNTLDKAKKAVNKTNNTNIRIINKDNGGLSSVRNRGIQEAKYDWVIFLDADDELLPNALADFNEAISLNSSAKLVIGGHYNTRLGKRSQTPPPILDLSRQKNFSGYINKSFGIANGSCAMHKNLFKALSYNENVRNGEDIPVFANILANHDAVSCGSLVAIIHRHNSSLRHNMRAELEVGMKLVNLIFDQPGMPEWTEGYRRKYATKRAISIAKRCYRQGYYFDSKKYYRTAIKTDPMSIFNVKALMKYILSHLRKEQS